MIWTRIQRVFAAFFGRPQPVPGILDLDYRFKGFASWEVALHDECVALMTTDPRSPILVDFFTEYEKAFTIPEETESLEGFRCCLELNKGDTYAELSSKYVPYREVVLLIRDRASTVIGGANFFALGGPTIDGKRVLTVNLNYLFVAPVRRGEGWSRKLLDLVSTESEKMFASGETSIDTVIFLEQNNPFELSKEDYESDTSHSGIDQVDRLRIWSNLGARLIDVEYIQPALSSSKQPLDDLVYSVIGASGRVISSCLVARHLRGFFGISFLQGRNMEEDPTACKMTRQLDELCKEGKNLSLVSAERFIERKGFSGESSVAGVSSSSIDSE